MNRVRFGLITLLAAAVAACSHNIDGELVSQPPLAGLRYVNLVPDTSALVFRVVDIVGDAPNTINATFRTGGWPYGVSTTLMPPHLGVQTGLRTIRVFLDGTTSAVASVQLLELQYDFKADSNYTVYLWGYANPAHGTPALSAMVVNDNVPTLDTASVAIRVIHLAPTLAPTLAAPAVNVTFDTLGVAAAPQAPCSGTRCTAFTNVQPGEVRPYQLFARRLAVTTPAPIAALNYRAAVAATATPTALGFAVDVPNGTIGTSTANPLAGDLVSGSALTAVIVPPSVAGTGSVAFATPSIVYLVDRRPPLTAP